MKKRLLKLQFIFVFIALSFRMIAQVQGNEADFSKMAEITPPPPDATALSTYGGVEVNLSTGAIAKAISLFSVTDRKIEVPISLSYISNGIKVNEYPSRVGMGWAFSAGGLISRIIYGKDDFLATRNYPSFNFQPNSPDAYLLDYLLKHEELGYGGREATILQPFPINGFFPLVK